MFQFPRPDSPVLIISEHEHDISYIGRFEDTRCFEARKGIKRHQETKIEENQARSRSRKNRTIRFPILEGPVFSDKVEFE
jgi:hypothetical protein